MTNNANKQDSSMDLKKETAFMRSEVTLEDVPEPADDTMTAVKSSVVLRVPPANDINDNNAL